jgi:hypothetical protein
MFLFFLHFSSLSLSHRRSGARLFSVRGCDTTCPFYISHLWSITSVLYVVDVWRRVFLFLWLSLYVDTLSAIFLPSSPLFPSFYNNSVSLVNYHVSSHPMFRLYVSRVFLSLSSLWLYPSVLSAFLSCSLCLAWYKKGEGFDWIKLVVVQDIRYEVVTRNSSPVTYRRTLRQSITTVRRTWSLHSIRIPTLVFCEFPLV